MTALPIEELPAVEDGVVGILRKPIDVGRLTETLNLALNRS
jgi:AmiR/NasT family two-component response regulator